MEFIGSQVRERIEETELEVLYTERNEAVLYNPESNKYEVWAENDDNAGYTVEINGVGYEFLYSFSM